MRRLNSADLWRCATTTRTQPEHGMTLIEITITVVIVAIIAAGVLSSITMAHMSDRNAKDVITAQHLAQQVMESVEVTPYNALLALSGATVTDGRFQAVTTATLVAVGLIRIEVQVTCAENAHVDMRVVTMFADRN